MTTAPAATPAPPPGPPPGPAPLTGRIMAALVGILIGALMSGVNARVGQLGLADVRGALGVSADSGSWLSSLYDAGEVLVMPFAPWFAITLGVRRFHQWMIFTCCGLAALMPFTRNLDLMLVMYFIQGIAAGALIPVLMMAALRYLPPPIRLHGLALYSLTATFAPNVAVQFAGYWTDSLFDWRWVYWEIVPAGFLAAALVSWGLPDDPIILPRFRQGNWTGLILGVPGLALLVIALTQGDRLDWLNSGLICWAFVASALLLGLFILSEWHHPAPFMRLQLLARRNLGLGFAIFLVLLVVMLAAVAIPAQVLGRVVQLKALQMAPLSLIVALPQFVIAPLVALSLYWRWVDARKVFAIGLAAIGAGCLLAAEVTSEWSVPQFVLTQCLLAVGEPMAVVALLFLATSVVQPMEGPYVSGIVNMLRALGSSLGGAVIGALMEWREWFHSEHLLDYLPRAQADPHHLLSDPAGVIAGQAFVLAAEDVLRAFGLLSLLLIPVVLRLTHIPAPKVK